MARVLVVLMVAASCGLFDAPQRIRLDELIHDIPFGETVHVTLSALRPLWDLPTVLSHSDAVVVGRVRSRRSEATGLPYDVSTSLVIVVNEVWLDRRAPPDGGGALERVVVRQPGGRAEYRGRFIEVQDNSFPVFSVGTDVVLFLSKGDGADWMEIVDGPHGAFVKEGQSIKSLLPTWHELRGRYDGLDLDSLKSLVAKALADAR
jgi:hypothetical protein